MLFLASSLSIKQFFSHMAFPVKEVRTSEERMRIIDEVEKTSSEKRSDVAK
jgi:hypothetical protein